MSLITVVKGHRDQMSKTPDGAIVKSKRAKRKKAIKATALVASCLFLALVAVCMLNGFFHWWVSYPW